MGRWVDETRDPTAMRDPALVIACDGAAWRQVRERYSGPLLVVDADLLSDGPRPAGVAVDGYWGPGRVSLADGDVIVGSPVPRLRGPALAGVPVGLGVRFDDQTAYLTPLVLSPSFRDPKGFWCLAGLLDRAVVALLGDGVGPYVEPWPDGACAARALTCDLDDLDDPARLDRLAASGRPATLFACADALPPRAAVAAQFEIAGHGDVHLPFGDDASNLSRVDRMLEQFHAAGWTLAGFSPPNLVYSSALAPLAERFRHLRLGYQGTSWRLFPTRADALIVTRVSFYTDFLHRYVGASECGRLLAAADGWASDVRGMSVPCFHPGLWTEPLQAYLQQATTPAWEAPLVEVAAWWEGRHAALERLRAGQAAAEPRLRLLSQRVDERLAALLHAVTGRRADDDALREPARVEVGRRSFVVVPASPAAAIDHSVPLDTGWSAGRWLPAWYRRRALRVANGGGVTAGLYAALPVGPSIRGGTVHLPVVVPDEPILLTAVGWREMLRPPRPAGPEREVTLRA
jgi:hypothetical protein